MRNKPLFSILSFFLLTLILSCEKDTGTIEYTEKKVLPFMKQRANNFAAENYLGVFFNKDTIVMFNETYNMPVIDTFIDAEQLYNHYLHPILKKFRLSVYYEMLGYRTTPSNNEISTAIATKAILNPEATYGNMIMKFICNFYIKIPNADYEEKTIIFYYNAKDDHLYNLI